jgi:hypothetical protein
MPSDSRTTRERREARAARLTEWADKRAEKATAASEQAHAMADLIPFGQPVLAGHHSQGRDQRYRDRISGKMDKASEHASKAREMSSKAANIVAATDASIFTDDPDATEALRARIARLESERARIVVYNASCRKGTPDPSVLDEYQRGGLESCRRVGQLRSNGSMPAYATANIGGRISADRKRLALLEGVQA